MKKKILIASILIFVVSILTAISVWANSAEKSLKRGEHNFTDTTEKIAVAYVEENYPETPDPDMFSHLIYAFGVFNDNLDGVVIKHPENLTAMAELKQKNPELKVILGLNDYRRPGFSEMASDKKKRKAYVKSVKETVKKYNLDGVDLDWEFPTIEGSGHNFTPEDDKNYVSLVKELRKALGKDAWISYYSYNTGEWIDHKRMLPYVTYVHASGYNLANPKEGKPLRHQSALYPSKKTGNWCISKVIERHMSFGIPKEKILIGIPFFGRGLPPFPSYVDWYNFSKYSSGLSYVWDEDAMAPYFCDDNGDLILGFDDERSITAKFDFIRTNELPGVFVWNYGSDLRDHRLGKAIGKLRKGITPNPTDSI